MKGRIADIVWGALITCAVVGFVWSVLLLPSPQVPQAFAQAEQPTPRFVMEHATALGGGVIAYIVRDTERPVCVLVIRDLVGSPGHADHVALTSQPISCDEGRK